jgi:HAD superfamily hydrolase (TIGR01509 family)
MSGAGLGGVPDSAGEPTPAVEAQRVGRAEPAGTPGLVIFDCDGVLVDSENHSNRVLGEMLGEHGQPHSTAQAREIFQGMRLDEVKLTAERMLGRELPADWIEVYERRRSAAFERELEPIAGAAQTVGALRDAGVAVCVASQGKLEKTRLSLQLTGLAQLFPDDARFSAHDVPRGKPAPDLFLMAAATMGFAPSVCVVVEDTPSGVLAASRAEIRAIGYAADSDADALRAAGAAETIEALPELLNLVGLR